MPVKKAKPTSPGRRFVTIQIRTDLTASEPQKSLTKGKKRISARNNNGRITIRFRGGGHKRRYREIDFKRNKDDIPAKVETIEYDPNRSANIALLCYLDGERRYIIAPQGLTVGDTVTSGEKAEIKPGCALPIKNIPVGTIIHNVELRPGKGAQMARSAGGKVQLLAREGSVATLKLSSGEVRKVPTACRATIGEVGNSDHNTITIGKAGRKRWMGRMPHNRGVAMNPVDHPHGGGEGKSSGGRHPCTPWGKPTKGYKTRKKTKLSDKLIVKRRR